MKEIIVSKTKSRIVKAVIYFDDQIELQTLIYDIWDEKWHKIGTFLTDKEEILRLAKILEN